MRVGDFCKHGVVTAVTTADVVEVAQTMRDEHVGFVVVIDENDPARTPRGVITDRDIVLGICARDVNPRAVTAADIMSAKPLVACETDDLNEAVQALTKAGALTGVIAIDDAIEVIAGLLCDVCGSIRNEQRKERLIRAS